MVFETASSATCIPMMVFIVILYLLPSAFDQYPDLDTYVAGYGFLGIYGTLLLTLLGVSVSIYYGFTCIAPKTVYRCGFYNCTEDGLVFPEDFPEELKKVYRAELKEHENDWYVPWSNFNLKLNELNNKFYKR